ncbi:hypothetical protein EB796_019274 [Bugula neritina]|uniref:Uncharacterized protein n=1 Tax=Bugula neritina TaxID=10212 RepID=A0A7J7JAN4_BUGNE|nr:hypothetical protein EB796_019274 [Bugula neritina]
MMVMACMYLEFWALLAPQLFMEKLILTDFNLHPVSLLCLLTPKLSSMLTVDALKSVKLNSFSGQDGKTGRAKADPMQNMFALIKQGVNLRRAETVKKPADSRVEIDFQEALKARFKKMNIAIEEDSDSEDEHTDW